MNLLELKIEIDMIRDDETLLGAYRMLQDLISQEDWQGLEDLVGVETAEVIRSDIGADPAGKDEYLELYRKFAEEDTTKFNEEIKQALKDASSFQVLGSLGEKFIQLDRRIEDSNRKSNLLAVAFADRLTDLIYPAAERAAKLTKLIVKIKPSPEAEKYLEEACLCYFYELYSACAVMCRSVLEETIEKRIEKLQIDHQLIEKGHTLGLMLKLARQPHLREKNIVPPEVWRDVDSVNYLGGSAVHQRPISESEAWKCLIAARMALAVILK